MLQDIGLASRETGQRLWTKAVSIFDQIQTLAYTNTAHTKISKAKGVVMTTDSS